MCAREKLITICYRPIMRVHLFTDAHDQSRHHTVEGPFSNVETRSISSINARKLFTLRVLREESESVSECASDRAKLRSIQPVVADLTSSESE